MAKFTGDSHCGADVRTDTLQFSIKGTGNTVEDSYSSLTDDGFSGVKVVVDRTETSSPCGGDSSVLGDFEMSSQELDPTPK